MTEQAPWWQAATGYQIYPRSFCDLNGDGVGDLQGIASKLDYLVELGVDFIWLSPVYASPMADNGYDISDYENIAPVFGTRADFETLLAQASDRNIRIVMDLVVNHTSDQHRWFQSALAGVDAPYRDYYVWRAPAADGGPPNALESFFGGPAWSLDAASGQYYLHLFDPRQPDLNWANRAMRMDIYAMMNRWLDQGVAGFRMDVIDLIGKDPDALITADGPLLHDYLREMHANALDGRDIVTVGEAWSATPDQAARYSGPDGTLSMVFQFEHVTAGWDAVKGKFKPKPLDWRVIKGVMDRWQGACQHSGWNSLFWSNHDLPRAVSKYGDDGRYRVESAKMLATVLHCLKGTPYVYQGEELGMTNAAFTRLDQFRDVETLNFHAILAREGVSEAEFLAGANANGRDNARTPMQWSAAPGAGFSDSRPWIDLAGNHDRINAEAALADPDSVFHHYRVLIALRKQLPVIREGHYVPVSPDSPQVWAYLRALGDARLLVIANLTSDVVRFEVPEGLDMQGQLVSSNYPRAGVAQGVLALQPFEAFALLEDPLS